MKRQLQDQLSRNNFESIKTKIVVEFQLIRQDKFQILD